MLPALVRRHAGHPGVLHGAAGDGLAAPDDRGVQERATDDEPGEEDVDDAHPLHRVGAEVFGVDSVLEMHAGEDEFLGYTFVALTAGDLEVGGVYGRARIARGEDVVNTMATGAICGDDRAALHGEAVVAVHVGGDTVSWNAELLRKADSVVATGTSVAGKILFGDR